MNAFVSAWSLLSKLVARKIENLEALLVICLIELFQLLILRSETALCCCVNDEQHLVGVLFQGNILSLSVLNGEFVNGSHFLFIYSNFMLLLKAHLPGCFKN